MADIGGWYWVSASNFQGPDNAVMIKKGGSFISGSSVFTFIPASAVLNLTGTLNVEGTLNAREVNAGAMATNQHTIQQKSSYAKNSIADMKMTKKNGNEASVDIDGAGELEIKEGADILIIPSISR